MAGNRLNTDQCSHPQRLSGATILRHSRPGSFSSVRNRSTIVMLCLFWFNSVPSCARVAAAVSQSACNASHMECSSVLLATKSLILVSSSENFQFAFRLSRRSTSTALAASCRRTAFCQPMRRRCLFNADGINLLEVVWRRATAAGFVRCVFDRDRCAFPFMDLGLRNRLAILQADLFAARDNGVPQNMAIGSVIKVHYLAALEQEIRATLPFL